MSNKKPHVLLILDGWGVREDQTDNAIAMANTPVWDELMTTASHTLLDASGLAVGLPTGQMGNSEVGHMSIGAGRSIPQDLCRVDQALQDGSLEKHPVLAELVAHCLYEQKPCHLLSLVSDGGVHSHINHLMGLVTILAKQGIAVVVHIFTDGRDTPPKSALTSVKQLENHIRNLKLNVRIASVSGRFYAMDRDQRWDRVLNAAEVLLGVGNHAHYPSASAAIEAAYARGETDEFIQPCWIDSVADKKPLGIAEKDAVIFTNFRSDRARQMTEFFTQDAPFKHALSVPQDLFWVTMTQYSENYHLPILFEPLDLTNTLGDVIAQQQGTQLRIAETEKYAHVTYFFSGGEEKIFPGEKRILIPSPKVKTYDLCPEMSVREVNAKLVEAIDSQAFDLLVCNFANGDMVGHTGNIPAAIQAVEAVDYVLKDLVAAVKRNHGELFITADHGNVEQMTDHSSGQPHTAHTCEWVPFVHVGSASKVKIKQGALSDIAPTVLAAMKKPIPKEMTGRVLVELI